VAARYQQAQQIAKGHSSRGDFNLQPRDLAVSDFFFGSHGIRPWFPSQAATVNSSRPQICGFSISYAQGGMVGIGQSYLIEVWRPKHMPSAAAITKGDLYHRRWVRTRLVLREAFLSFLKEDSLMVAGSIAYHSLLAIFPLLLLLLGISGLYIHHFELVGGLSVVLQRYLPVRTDFIMQNLVGISRAYGRIGLLSFGLLLWSSSGVFVPLEKALNRAWEVEQGRPWWRSRLMAVEMAAIVACLLLISTLLVGSEFLFRLWLRRALAPSLSFLTVFIFHMLTATSSFAIALMAFVVLFERLPNRSMGFRHAFPGALFTALLWEVARWVVTILLPHFNYRQVYGSIGVVVALMTWAYISSAVILFGAQVSRTLYGTLKAPAPAATSLPAPVVTTVLDPP
jgi:membrane protein